MSPAQKLGEMLIGKGLISQEQLENALAEQQKNHAFLGEILVKRGYLEDIKLVSVLSEQLSIPVEELADQYINWELLKRFSASLILDYRCFPLRSDGKEVTMAITNPFDLWAMKRAEEEAHPFALKLVLCTKAGMDEAISRYRAYMKTNR